MPIALVLGGPNDIDSVNLPLERHIIARAVGYERPRNQHCPGVSELRGHLGGRLSRQAKSEGILAV